MGKAFGLSSHIWANSFRSLLLLGILPVVALAVVYALNLLLAAGGLYGGAGEMNPFGAAVSGMVQSVPIALIVCGVWFVIMWLFHRGAIDAMVGGRGVSRTDEPEIYALLENLCISRGITTPKLTIAEVPELNAFATGLHPGQYAITLTRGLINTLDKAELETVIAHELTHIRNSDVRLMVLAGVFVGIIAFVGEMVFRGLGNTRFSSGDSDSRSSNSGGSSGIAAAVIVALIIMAVAWFVVVLVRLALSRRREYLADAGAVELTKNPDALVSALQKISGNPAFQNVPSEIRAMCIEAPHRKGDLFSTHPAMDRRIGALVEFAGARVRPQPATPEVANGPWG
jgi:heat shock protein HtpX